VQLRLRGEVHRVVAARDQKYQSNFVEVSKSRCCHPRLAQVNHLGPTQFRNYKIVYRRYAGLYFCVCVDANDNELAYLEAIHLFVEILGAFGLPIKVERCPGGLYRKQTPFLIMSASWTWCSISIRFAVPF
jgi:Clathrin adaptor complex small chain